MILTADVKIGAGACFVTTFGRLPDATATGGATSLDLKQFSIEL